MQHGCEERPSSWWSKGSGAEEGPNYKERLCKILACLDSLESRGGEEKEGMAEGR